MFFMPENSIPKGGYLKIGLPTSSFTPTACNAWDLTGASSLKWPGDTATASFVKGTISGNAPTFYCTWAAEITGGKAWGMHFDAAGTTLTAG